MERRIITTDVVTEEEKKIEGTLRPQYLKDYIGQTKIKSILKVFIDAAKSRGESLDHVLFYGPPGLGKTTLCGIIANEMGVNMKVTSGAYPWLSLRSLRLPPGQSPRSAPSPSGR